MKKIQYIIYLNGKKILKSQEFIKKYLVNILQLILLKSPKENLNLIMPLVPQIIIIICLMK